MIKIQQNLSKNIICSWEILKKDIKYNYNIISCSFFIKKDSYKDIDYYKNGLINIINNFNKILPNYILRIYYDDTVIDILNNILNNNINNIELYKYNIDIFKDGLYHKGTIGTFMRFLPLFNLEYHKVDKCIIFDIDNKLHNYYNKLILYFDKYNIKIAYRSRFCYLSKRIIISKNKYPIIASFIYQSIQLPYDILSNFFEKLYINNDKKIIDYIHKSDIINIYEYGIDEFFLNKYYIKYIIKYNINFMIILFNHIDILSGFKKIFKYYNDNDKITIKIWNIMYNFYKTINVDLNNLLNYNKLNNKNILEILNKYENILEKYILKNINNNYLKKYIIKELNNNYNYEINILLTCILNNLYININKINILYIKKYKIKYYKYLDF